MPQPRAGAIGQTIFAIAILTAQLVANRDAASAQNGLPSYAGLATSTFGRTLHIANADIRGLEAAVRQHPGDRAFILALGRAYLFAGDRGSAIALLGDYLKRSAGDADAQLLLARAYALNHDFAASEARYRVVLQLRPSDEAAELGLAESLALGGHFEEARGVYAGVLAGHPADYDARIGAAAVETYLGMYSAARSDYRLAIAVRPDDPEALVGLARIEFVDREFAAARRHVARALAIAPLDPEALELKRRLDDGLAPILETATSALNATRTYLANQTLSQRWYASPSLQVGISASRLDLAAQRYATHADRFGIIAKYAGDRAANVDFRIASSKFYGLASKIDSGLMFYGDSNSVNYSAGYSIGGIDESIAASDQIISPLGAGIRVTSMFVNGGIERRANAARLSLRSAAYSDGNRYHEFDVDVSHEFPLYAGSALVISAAARLAGFEENYSYYAYAAHGYYDYFAERDVALSFAAQGRLGPNAIAGIVAGIGSRRTKLQPGWSGPRASWRAEPYLQVDRGRFALEFADTAAHYDGSAFVRPYEYNSLQFTVDYRW